jgi:hypothetical protein
VQEVAPVRWDRGGTVRTAEECAGDRRDGVGVPSTADSSLESQRQMFAVKTVGSSICDDVMVMADHAPWNASTTQPLY